MINPEKFFKSVERIKDEDLRQDCYLKICELAKDFEGDDKEFEKYLSVHIKYLRQHYYEDEAERKSLTTTIEGSPVLGYEDSNDLAASIDAKDKLEALERNIKTKEYAILRLFHEDGLTAQEIAEQHPNLNIKNPKQVYNTVAKYKRKYEPK